MRGPSMTSNVSAAARTVAGDRLMGRLSPLPPWQVTAPSLVEAPVVCNTHVGDRYFWLRLHAPAITRHSRPGQFIMLSAVREARCEPVLPRPMALLDWDAEAGYIDVIYGVVGASARKTRCAGICQRGICCFNGSASMWTILALLCGLLTAGIQDTSLSSARMKSASPRIGFWPGSFHWVP